MEESYQKLKYSVANSLILNDQNLDEPYLVSGNKTYSRRELATEISNETDFGVKLMSNIMILSLDLISRNKE